MQDVSFQFVGSKPNSSTISDSLQKRKHARKKNWKILPQRDSSASHSKVKKDTKIFFNRLKHLTVVTLILRQAFLLMVAFKFPQLISVVSVNLVFPFFPVFFFFFLASVVSKCFYLKDTKELIKNLPSAYCCQPTVTCG